MPIAWDIWLFITVSKGCYTVNEFEWSESVINIAFYSCSINFDPLTLKPLKKRKKILKTKKLLND